MDLPRPSEAGRIADVRCALAGGRLAGARGRELAAWVTGHDPRAGDWILAAMAFHGRAARWAVTEDGAAGVAFASSGLPCGEPPHAAAMRAAPGTRYVYADANEETVLQREAIDGGPRVSAVCKLARDAKGLLGSPEVTAIGTPVMLQLQQSLHHWAPDVARRVLRDYGRLLPAGSTLALSWWEPAGTGTGERFLGICSAAAGWRLHGHPAGTVASWLEEAGLSLAWPGITDARAWPLQVQGEMAPRSPGRILTAVARRR